MLLTNLLIHISFFRLLYLWWRRHQETEAILAPLVANPTHKQRQQQCLWCWKENNPHAEYPSHLTSSMCGDHKQRQRATLAASRAARRQEVAA